MELHRPRDPEEGSQDHRGGMASMNRLPQRLTLCFLLAAAGAALSYAGAEKPDLVIRNGRVADGTGNPAFFGDVAVKDGKIVAVGRVPGGAKAEYDARGRVVAPGFID